MMRRAHIALTPGRDFGHAETAHYARLACASAMDYLHYALRRL